MYLFLSKKVCFTLLLLEGQRPVTALNTESALAERRGSLSWQYEQVGALMAIQLLRCLQEVSSSHQLRHNSSDKEHSWVYFKDTSRLWDVILSLTQKIPNEDVLEESRWFKSVLEHLLESWNKSTFSTQQHGQAASLPHTESTHTHHLTLGLWDTRF